MDDGDNDLVSEHVLQSVRAHKDSQPQHNYFMNNQIEMRYKDLNLVDISYILLVKTFHR